MVGKCQVEPRHRKADDIRVELTLNNALKLVERKGPDVVEMFSQPRLCKEIAGRSFGGTTLRPGFSLDLIVWYLYALSNALRRAPKKRRTKKTQPWASHGT